MSFAYFDRLAALAGRGGGRFHVPGHKGNPAALGPLGLDTVVLPVL